MKLYARIENEKGKVDGMGGNEYLDIDITVGNEVLVKLTLKEAENGEFALFDENDFCIKGFGERTEECAHVLERHINGNAIQCRKCRLIKID